MGETTFKKLKHALLELLRGYPSYRFYGKIESYLRESGSSLNVLEKDGIIEFASREEAEILNKTLTLEEIERLKTEGRTAPRWYRLASKGVDLAISMINLEYGKKMLRYSKETNKSTTNILYLTTILLALEGVSIFIIIMQILKIIN